MKNIKIRVYLDTSVLSAYYDDRVTDRQQQTEEFWKRFSQFEISTSELTEQELAQTPDAEQRLKGGKNALFRLSDDG